MKNMKKTFIRMPYGGEKPFILRLLSYLFATNKWKKGCILLQNINISNAGPTKILFDSETPFIKIVRMRKKGEDAFMVGKKHLILPFFLSLFGEKNLHFTAFFIIY